MGSEYHLFLPFRGLVNGVNLRGEQALIASSALAAYAECQARAQQRKKRLSLQRRSKLMGKELEIL